MATTADTATGTVRQLVRLLRDADARGFSIEALIEVAFPNGHSVHVASDHVIVVALYREALGEGR